MADGGHVVNLAEEIIPLGSNIVVIGKARFGKSTLAQHIKDVCSDAAADAHVVVVDDVLSRDERLDEPMSDPDCTCIAVLTYALDVSSALARRVDAVAVLADVDGVCSDKWRADVEDKFGMPHGTLDANMPEEHLQQYRATVFPLRPGGNVHTITAQPPM